MHWHRLENGTSTQSDTKVSCRFPISGAGRIMSAFMIRYSVCQSKLIAINESECLCTQHMCVRNMRRSPLNHPVSAPSFALKSSKQVGRSPADLIPRLPCLPQQSSLPQSSRPAFLSNSQAFMPGPLAVFHNSLGPLPSYQGPPTVRYSSPNF